MNVFQCVSMMRSACCIWCASPVTCPSVVFAHLPSGISAPAPARVMPRCYKAIQDKMTTLSLHWVYTEPTPNLHWVYTESTLSHLWSWIQEWCWTALYTEFLRLIKRLDGPWLARLAAKWSIESNEQKQAQAEPARNQILWKNTVQQCPGIIQNLCVCGFCRSPFLPPHVADAPDVAGAT